jgi:uncharacterized protein YegL
MVSPCQTNRWKPSILIISDDKQVIFNKFVQHRRHMSRVRDMETGNPERKVDIKMLLNLTQVSTFNKMKGNDFLGRLGNFTNYMDLGHKG